MWKSKLRAFALHFAVTAVVIALVAWLIFGVWYPAPFEKMLGGMGLLVLVGACDLVLGPLMSLVIYSPSKSRKALMGDYAVVVAIQLVVLAYGVNVTAQARPSFLVFTIDRYVVVQAGELDAAERAQAVEPQWRGLRLFDRYQTVYVEREADADASQELIFSALSGGRDLQHVVKNYRPVAEHREEVIEAAKPLALLRQRFPARVADIDQALADSGLPPERVLWLPAQAGNVFWTVLIDRNTALPVAWVELDTL